MKLIKDIELKVSNLEAELKKHNNYVTEITQTMEKLLSDKAITINNINILNGALQAYRDVINGVKSGDSSEVAEGLTVAAQEVESVLGSNG
jgi:hypothetical protein